MTDPLQSRGNTPSEELLSLLPPDPALRVTQAEYSRLVGVSRQTVSQWCKKGIIIPYPDGRFCPREATRRLIDLGDPSRLRAKVLRPLTMDISTLRAELEVATRRTDQAATRSHALQAELNHVYAAVDRLLELVLEDRATIANLDAGELGIDWLHELLFRALDETLDRNAPGYVPSDFDRPPPDGG